MSLKLLEFKNIYLDSKELITRPKIKHLVCQANTNTAIANTAILRQTEMWPADFLNAASEARFSKLSVITGPVLKA